MRNKVHLIIIAWIACLLLTACGAEQNMKKGEKFLAIGEYYDAANQFRQAYQATPAKERSLRGKRAAKMAYCYDKINESQRAIAAYRNVIRYKQDDAETHLRLADNLMKTGSYREAEKEYQIAIDSLTAAPKAKVVNEKEEDNSQDVKKGKNKKSSKKDKKGKSSAKDKKQKSSSKDKKEKSSSKDKKDESSAKEKKVKKDKDKRTAKATVRRERVKVGAGDNKQKADKKAQKEAEKADKKAQKEAEKAAKKTAKEQAKAEKGNQKENKKEDKKTSQNGDAAKTVTPQKTKKSDKTIDKEAERRQQLLAAAYAGLQSAQSAPKQKADGSRYKVKKMEVFNSRRSDYSPMLFGDQYDQLYWTSTRNEAQGDELSGITGTKPGDIFYSEKNDKGKWSKPEAISTGLNTEFDEGTPAFSADNREMFITQCLTDPSYPRYATIAVSNRSDAAWGKATKVELSKDTLSNFAHPALSPDGNWLYFVSDMPGGKGGKDIWRVRITGGSYGGIENVGAPVNTPGDEEFPTFRPNGDLYFSSNGHADGMGGLDIYIAKVGEDRKWHIEHPGYPLNSQGDDFGCTFEGVHNRGFFSSNRGDGKGWDHIYSFECPEIVQTVKGWVYEMEGYELPAAQVYMVGNDGTNLKLSVKGDGSFEQVIHPDVQYIILATCKGYLNHKEELRVGPVEDSEQYVLQFPLASIRVPVMIDNIFYDFDKATLRPESKTALDELVKLLKENPNVTIELSAHCDFKGSAEYNKRLSQRRAESVVNYLTANGIAADRLSPVGYGKEKPKTIRKKLTEKYPWLKENDVLTEEFIMKLDPEKQEICNQLNRRTEFVVTRTTYGMFDDKGNLKNPPKPKEESSDANDEDSFNFEIE